MSELSDKALEMANNIEYWNGQMLGAELLAECAEALNAKDNEIIDLKFDFDAKDKEIVELKDALDKTSLVISETVDKYNKLEKELQKYQDAVEGALDALTNLKGNLYQRDTAIRLLKLEGGSK